MRRRFPVTLLLLVALSGLVLTSGGTMFFLALNNALRSTQDAFAIRIGALIEEAQEASRANFTPLEEVGQWLAKEIAGGVIDPRDEYRFKTVLSGALATLPQGDAVSFQFTDGTGYFFDADTGMLQAVEWPPEWRVSQRGVDSEGLWVLRPGVLDGRPLSTFLATARDANGDQIGTVGVRANLQPLSSKLSRGSSFRGHELVRFLLLNGNVVIAHPLLAGTDGFERPTIDMLDDPYLRALETGDRFTPDLIAPIDGVEVFVLRGPDGRDRIFAMAADRERITGGEITVGVHFDEAAGWVEIRRLLTVAGVGLGLVILSVAVAVWVGRRAARPIRRLAEAAEAVSRNELDAVPVLPPSRTIELDNAARAFNAMVEGLREREKIRGLFGKYVPEDVARLLLRDDGAGRPKAATGTVLFLDIAGFTSIAETLEPGAVVDTMNAFFSDAVTHIEAEKGIVTQFQGDALLAVFNDPVPEPDHARHALLAAERILRSVDARDFAGQTLSCRIGINTGPFVSGAVGAEKRLSYTVHGDAVNIAARLEQLNKEFGTRLLLTETTAAAISGHQLQKVATLPLRGRRGMVSVFTLASEAPDAPREPAATAQEFPKAPL